MKSTFSRETIELLVSDFYKDVLCRPPDPIGLLNMVGHVIRMGSDPDALASVLESFRSSKEYKNLLIKNFPSFKYPVQNEKVKVAIWGTREESRLIFLLLTYKSKGIDIDCFIDDNGFENFCGLPVKKPDELDSSIDHILITNTFGAYDNIFEQIDFNAEKSRVATIDIRQLLIILPDDSENGRLDSAQWGPLLGKEVTILGDSKTGLRLAGLIQELNKVFEIAFEETIQIRTIVEQTGQLAADVLQGKIILITQNEYVDALSDLLLFGVSLEDIRIVRFTSDQAKLEDQFMKDGDIFVYTMPKVGTNSFYNSLRQYGMRKIFTHSLYPSPVKARDILPDGEPTAASFVFKVNWIMRIDAAHVKTYLQKYLHRQKLLVITGVRNPLDRILSSFFQEFDGAYQDGVRAIPSHPDSLYPEITDYVMRNFTSEDWFNCELKSNLQIDVYQHPFDCSKGYQIIEENKVRLLIIRIENLDNVWEKAIIEWLGKKRPSGMDLPLLKANETSKKGIADLYKEVKSSIKFDPKLIEDIYSTQYAKHFYSQEELERFKQKWL